MLKWQLVVQYIVYNILHKVSMFTCKHDDVQTALVMYTENYVVPVIVLGPVAYTINPSLMLVFESVI